VVYNFSASKRRRALQTDATEPEQELIREEKRTGQQSRIGHLLNIISEGKKGIIILTKQTKDRTLKPPYFRAIEKQITCVINHSKSARFSKQ
jgi:hypothetical protein